MAVGVGAAGGSGGGDPALRLPGRKVGECFPASTRSAGLRQTDSRSTEGVSRLRVSLGYDPQTFRSHVLGSVPVPEVVGATPGTLAIPERKHAVLISHFKQSFVDGKNRSTWTKRWLFHRALYATWGSSFSACGIQP